MSELKPCPFCGAAASTNDGGNSTYGRFWWRVGCVDCGVFFNDQEVWTDDHQLSPDHPPKSCFGVWNTRADLCPTQSDLTNALQANMELVAQFAKAREVALREGFWAGRNASANSVFDASDYLNALIDQPEQGNDA